MSFEIFITALFCGFHETLLKKQDSLYDQNSGISSEMESSLDRIYGNPFKLTQVLDEKSIGKASCQLSP